MVTAQELIVAIRSEGVSDTTDDLNSMEESFTSTSEQASDTSENLEGFTANIRGAVSAAVAGFAVSTATLASQVPIVGEAFAGINAILSAFGLQVDQLARQLGGEGLNKKLFDTAGAVSEADGAAGDAAGVFAILATAVGGILGPLALLKARALGAKGIIKALKSGFKTAAKQALRFGGVLLSVPGAFAAIGAAVFGFFAAYALGIGDIRSKTDTFANGVETKFESFLRNIRQTLLGIKDGVKNEFSNAIGVINTAVDTLNDSIVSSLDDAESDLRSFLLGVRETLLSVKEDIVGFFSDIGSTVKDSLPDQILNENGSIDVNPFNDDDTSPDSSSNDTGRAGEPRPQRAESFGTSIDGRRLNESTGRFGRDGTARRGP